MGSLAGVSTLAWECDDNDMRVKPRKGPHARKNDGPRNFAQKTFRLGETQRFQWDKALATAEAMEDEELSRKLSSRK